MISLVAYVELLGLGAVAGFTIFLGLPLAALQKVSPTVKGFLNAVAMGILIFLIVDVFAHALEPVEEAAVAAFAGTSPLGDAATALFALFGGLTIGLLGLAFYETRYLAKARPDAGPIGGDAYRLATMIAIGIGAHNFIDGLAIGQSLGSVSIGLAVLLIIGFGAHNSTEGFGIAGPLTGLSKRPSVRFLIAAGLIGGGPTFLGTLVGQSVVNTTLSIAFLALAAGSILYVVIQLMQVAMKTDPSRS